MATKFADLNGITAKVIITKMKYGVPVVRLTLLCESSIEGENGSYCPAESVTIHGTQSLIDLHSMIGEALPEVEKLVAEYNANPNDPA